MSIRPPLLSSKKSHSSNLLVQKTKAGGGEGEPEIGLNRGKMSDHEGRGQVFGESAFPESFLQN